MAATLGQFFYLLLFLFFFDIQYYRIIIGLSEFKYKFTKGNLYAPVQLSKHILLLWYIPIWQLSQQDWVVQCMFIIKSRWAIWIKPSSCSAFSWAQSSRPPLVALYFQTRQKVTQCIFTWLPLCSKNNVVWWGYVLDSFFCCVWPKRDRKANSIHRVFPSNVFWEVGLVTSVWIVSVPPRSLNYCF